MGCPFMRDPEVADKLRSVVAEASPRQRAAALPHAQAAAKAPSVRVRASAVVSWLRALGQDPRTWL